MTAKYRPRRLRLSDGREVTLRAIVGSDAAEIVQAFERLSDDSRYYRFMHHIKQLDPAVLDRGVHPRPGVDFVFVAVVRAGDGIDIVGAAQYVREGASNAAQCEFAVTVAEDWRKCGLATALLGCLLRRARHDGYTTMKGLVIAENLPMLALARTLKFAVMPVPEDATVVSVQRVLGPGKRRRPPRRR